MAAVAPPSAPPAKGDVEGKRFLLSCATGDAGAMQSYLSAGGDAAFANDDGVTAPMALAMNAWTDAKPGMLRTLLAAGASATAATTAGVAGQEAGQTALHLSARHESPALVELLLDAGGADPNTADSSGATPLFLAAMDRREAVVAALLSRGADADAATEHGCDALIILAEPLPTPAAPGCDGRLVAALAGAGTSLARADCDGFTALHSAAMHRNLELLKALLEAGADPNALTRDQLRVSPLMLAVNDAEAEHAWQVEAVHALVAAGASLSHSVTDAAGRDAYALCCRMDLRLLLCKLGEDRPLDDDGEGLDAAGLPEDPLERMLAEMTLARHGENERCGRVETEDEVFAACVGSSEWAEQLRAAGQLRDDHDDFTDRYTQAQKVAADDAAPPAHADASK